MDYNNETGDIMIEKGWPGHVGMIYDEGDDDHASYIHAQGGTNFHITPIYIAASYTYHKRSETVNVYRPPWKYISMIGFNSVIDSYKAKLKQMADKIKQSATYGRYRAFRLELGDSKFDSDARERLEKYKSRLDNKSGKFVTTVTCAEAVMLCYQLTFAESHFPFFIGLDAAHTMPHTLEKWLIKSGWEEINQPKKKK